MDINELIKWHLHNAKECERDQENDQALFHWQAMGLLVNMEYDRQQKERASK